ncbi:putative baseplate assembly protein [Phormidesmis sp. 146-12]
MEFDFLPKLPNSNLDDRAYRDLVEECILRIPRYCPEWTNHNPSDPGITLIELFAWLTDQMQLRFNQVPRRNYVAFLELLGIHLKSPTPAQTDLTFYLSSAQDSTVVIPRDTEVATERTATDEAIVFSTNQDLIVGNPRIKHFLTRDTDQADFENRFHNSINERSRDWQNMGETSLFTESLPGNSFYLALDTSPTEEAQSIQGNVIELIVRGESATGTGIDPNEPPRVWQAWNGHQWQSVLRQEVDDRTKGFNFGSDATAQGRLREASVILHLPQDFPEAEFGDCQGHWIRCVYETKREYQRTYSVSPRIVGLRIQAIGGTIPARQCIRVREELLGTSTGKPGQAFPLQMQPVLDRQAAEEYIEVKLSDGMVEAWQEVPDFSRSSSDDPHYTIDARTGTVQFGPLIRGPMRLRQQTYDRAQIQASVQRAAAQFQDRNSRERVLSPLSDPIGGTTAFTERQYGRVPPPGAEVYMKSYQFGGGRQGNVQAEKLTILRSSLPYITRVTSYEPAQGGADAESLEEAVMRVPQQLRTRECAVTPEDFETVSKALPGQKVARSHCLRESQYSTPGVVRLLIVPQVETDRIDWTQGMNPDRVFSLSTELRQEMDLYLRDRRPLGIKVELQEPEYVGVSVCLSVLLESRSDRESIRRHILVALYQFLNPIVGGVEGQGWSLGRPVYTSDIISLCQKIPGIRHLGAIELFEVRKQEDGWNLLAATDSMIAPSPLGYLCSWAGDTISSSYLQGVTFAPHGKSDPGHEINFVEP